MTSYIIGVICVVVISFVIMRYLSTPLGPLFLKERFIPKNLPLENGNYALIVNNKGVYGLIDDSSLLIQERDSITIGIDFYEIFPSKDFYSLSLYKDYELIKTKSVLYDDNMDINTIKDHLIPLNKVIITGNRKEIELAQDSIQNKPVYYLQKPRIKTYDYSFRITLPTIIVKVEDLIDERDISPFSYKTMKKIQNKMKNEIEDRVNQRFPKGKFEIDEIGQDYPRRNAWLRTSEGMSVGYSNGKMITDDGRFFYFNYCIDIVCEPDYYGMYNAIDFATFFNDIPRVKESEFQTFFNQKVSLVDTEYYPPPYSFDFKKMSYEISALKENEYSLIYLEETHINKMQ